MTEYPRTYGWRGVHLFVAGSVLGPSGDRIVLDVVEPCVRQYEARGWIDRWFFLRYYEDGSHLRCRFFGALSTLEDELIPAFEQTLRARDPDILNSAIRRVVWVPYVPEIDRYGGIHGLALAEDCFHYSSEFAVAALRALSPDTRAPRLARALLATMVGAHVFYGNRLAVANFARTYAVGYLRGFAAEEAHRSWWMGGFDDGFTRQSDILTTYIEDTWERLEDHDTLTDDLDALRARLLSVRARFVTLCGEGRMIAGDAEATLAAATDRIVPSYIHMTNNRLGVSIADEAYVAHLLYRVLTAGAAAAHAGTGQDAHAS